MVENTRGEANKRAVDTGNPVTTVPSPSCFGALKIFLVHRFDKDRSKEAKLTFLGAC